MSATAAQARILVIKLGALSDVVQATGPFAAIRRHHADARITLLTTAPYTGFLEASGLFDEVWVDARPSFFDPKGWWRLRRRLRSGRFDRVYDLQTSDRSGHYFRLLGPGRPEWSGIARGCSHPHLNPGRDAMHTLTRQAEQLAAAGISEVPPPSVDWASAQAGGFALSAPYVLLVPGGAAHRPEKRWPVKAYTGLARRLAARGVTPVLIGGGPEAHVTGTIAGFCEAAVDLTASTSLADLVGLAEGARAAVGNDTGPMHLIAAAGCPSVVLYSHASDPALCAQRGAAVTILRREKLDALGVDEVEAALKLD